MRVDRDIINAFAEYFADSPVNVDIVHGNHYGLPILAYDGAFYAIACDDAERRRAVEKAVTEYFDDMLPEQYRKYFDYDRVVHDAIADDEDTGYLSEYNHRYTTVYRYRTYYIYQISDDILY